MQWISRTSKTVSGVCFHRLIKLNQKVLNFLQRDCEKTFRMNYIQKYFLNFCQIRFYTKKILKNCIHWGIYSSIFFGDWYVVWNSITFVFLFESFQFGDLHYVFYIIIVCFKTISLKLLLFFFISFSIFFSFCCFSMICLS